MHRYLGLPVVLQGISSALSCAAACESIVTQVCDEKHESFGHCSYLENHGRAHQQSVEKWRDRTRVFQLTGTTSSPNGTMAP
jgi:hypothetical protein